MRRNGCPRWAKSANRSVIVEADTNDGFYAEAVEVLRNMPIPIPVPAMPEPKSRWERLLEEPLL